jgi:5-methylcytosine-specific restriction endonuclease McrA
VEVRGVQDWAYQFYNSKQWKKCREAYKKAMHYQCEYCGSAGELVHHKEALTRDNITNAFIALSFNNLRLLCRKCHGAEHGSSVTAEGVCFDASGNLIAIPPSEIFIKGDSSTGRGTFV